MTKIKTPTILITGALGQIGTELTIALREKYGSNSVIATDRYEPNQELLKDGPYFQLDVLNKYELEKIAAHLGITQIYHLAAILSGSGEQNPQQAWDLNMQSLLHVLEIATQAKIEKVFWPSSIAVFGKSSPQAFCPQSTVTEPATIYGISKLAGEQWCNYYFEKYGLDVRSLRYPGLISHTAKPGGGTTDYAVDIFHQAIKNGHYTCYLSEHTALPMMYMPDAIRATLAIMDSPIENINIRTSYNLWGMTFNPKMLAEQIQLFIPDFKIDYQPDFRQHIADSWPSSMNGHHSSKDWGWKAEYEFQSMVADMLYHLGDETFKIKVKEISSGQVSVPYLEHII